MNATLIRKVGLVLCLQILSLNVAGYNAVYAANYCERHAEVVNTDAGHIDFSFVSYIKNPAAYQKIRQVYTDEKAVDLDNGSRWSVSKVDMVKGWEKSKVVVTQNHASFSTSRYAILNPELKLAIPASLVREPVPTKDTLFITTIDRVNDIITLSDGKKWIVHASDRGNISKMADHDRVIIGVNSGDDKDKSPYLLIDTANHHFVRAHIIE